MCPVTRQLSDRERVKPQRQQLSARAVPKAIRGQPKTKSKKERDGKGNQTEKTIPCACYPPGPGMYSDIASHHREQGKNSITPFRDLVKGGVWVWVWAVGVPRSVWTL